MAWNYAEQLQSSSKQRVSDSKTPEMTYYRNGAVGNRVHKVTEYASPNESHRKMKETLYLTGCDIYVRYKGDGIEVKLR